MASPQTNGHQPTPPPSSDAPTSRTLPSDPSVPLLSSASSKQPRDARLIHTILSNLGITSYQERVPLQLLDFAYRYTSSVLSDSLRLSAEGYSAAAPPGNKRGGGAEEPGDRITVTSLRAAIASRQGFAFEGRLGKEFLLEQAAERNRVALPKVERGYGLQLPEERYCLTGVGWGLEEEWESSVDDDEAHEWTTMVNGTAGSSEDQRMGGMDGAAAEDGDEDEEGAGRMEDVFGEGGEGDDVMRDD